MNLYKILFKHYSQKDSEEGIKKFILAKNDTEVFDHIEEKHNYGTWGDQEEDFEPEEDGPQTYKEKLIKLKGQMYDEDYELHDLYYGATLYGWELVQENISGVNISILKQIGILTND